MAGNESPTVTTTTTTTTTRGRKKRLTMSEKSIAGGLTAVTLSKETEALQGQRLSFISETPITIYPGWYSTRGAPKKRTLYLCQVQLPAPGSL